jgi:glutathione S-transferase
MYKLYNVKGWGSMAPHFVLEELGVPYTNVWLTAEQVKAPEFRELSPLGLIPALGLADGSTMVESAAIVAFLTTVHADKGLSPPLDTPAYGVYLSSLHFMSTNIYPAINLAFGSSGTDGYALTPEHGAHIAAKATARVHEFFGIVETRLTEDGPYLLGETFSALDIYLFMLTIWARPSESAVLAKFPRIAGVAAAVRARPKLKAAIEAHGVDRLDSYGQ